MTLIHDIIKIKYSKLGYLPGYPYHLISDEEMFNAFILLNPEDEEQAKKEHFFEDNYPNPFSSQDINYTKLNAKGDPISTVSLSKEYETLKEYIIKVINAHIQYSGTEVADFYPIPNWIYTYMLGEVVYQNSSYLDIYDTLALLNCSNTNNKFTNIACANCYATSLKYISSTSNIRPPTVFGEPHVIKQLRLEA